LGISSRVETSLTSFIQKCLGWELMSFLMNFLSCQSSNEYWNTVPDDLKDLSRRNLWNIDFKIGVSVVSSPSVESSNDSDCVKSCEISQGSIVYSTQHVNLSSSDVSLLFIMHSILIEPIIESYFEINMISEVSRPRWSHKKLWLIRN